jgi:hypothetical protein
MAAPTNKSKAKKTSNEHYLKLPSSILNLRDLGLCEKVLLAHIYSFGAKGCWQSNATLAEIFMVCPRTISQWIAVLKRTDLIQVKSPKGYYRTLWARSHPDIRQSGRVWYRDQSIPIPGNPPEAHLATSSMEDSNILHSQCAESRHRPGKMLRPTNNITIKETTKQTIAPPSPLPAGGPAPAVLTERRAENLRRTRQFVQNFGVAKKVRSFLSDEEIEKRKQQQLQALMKP